ncbi:MAG: hypothetical protein NC089_09665 [Bacteroides sp.]|nr:hypothetical protein [Bacteroides sp.]MCM1549100.1 hypothetical protein [Clostridium sp.]
MDEIKYQEVCIEEGLLKNKQVRVTVYTNRLELEYSQAMPSKKLKEVQSQIPYVEKEIVYYDKVTDYKHMERKVIEGITGYQFFFVGDFETERGGKRGKTTNVSFQSVNNRGLWDAIAMYTPLLTAEEQRVRSEEAIAAGLENASVEKGVLEVEVSARMIKTMKLFINGVDWKQYTYPPVRVSLPFGTYQVKIARGVPHMDMEYPGGYEMDYAYTNEVSITISKACPVVRLAADEGLFSPSLRLQ